MGKVAYETLVYKAGLPLASGESVSQYMGRLREAANEHVKKKLNLSTKNSYVFMVETYKDSTVMDVMTRTGDDQPTVYKYYATTYTRKATGDFEFGPMVEVERVTSFQPKQTALAVAKSADQKAEPEPAKTQKEHLPGWVAAEKSSLWSGVI